MNALKREYFHVPLYAWLAGIAALGLAFIYFARARTTSSNVSGPQAALTPYPTSNAGMNVPPIIPINLTISPPPAPPLPQGVTGRFTGGNVPYPMINPVLASSPAVPAALGGAGKGIGAAPWNYGASFVPTRTPFQTTNLPQNAYPAPVGR